MCGRYFSERAATDPNFSYLPNIFAPDAKDCLSPPVQRNVTALTLTISVITGALSAITAPRLGALSDRYGRKRIMVIASSGGLVGEVITILAANFPDKIHYNWLILSAFVDGLAGSFTVGSVMSQSYTSDCTPPSKRAVAIGYMHACLSVGMALGPLFGGFVVEKTGSLLSMFYLVLGCHIVFILYIIVLLPESVSKRRQMLAREKHAKMQAVRAAGEEDDDLASAASGPSATLRVLFRGIRKSNPLAPLRILLPPGRRLGKVRRNLVILAAMDTILLTSIMSSGSVTMLYAESMFHWGNLETSEFISLLSMVRVLVLMVIFPIINYVFRTRPAQRRRRESGVAPVEVNAGADEIDVWLIRTAVISDILGVTGYVFVRTPALFVMCGVITAFGGLGMATIQSSLTKQVPSERVGALLGAIGLLHAIARIIAPLIFSGLYMATLDVFPQAVYVLVSTLFTIVFGMSLFVRPHGMSKVLSSLAAVCSVALTSRPAVYLTESDDVPSPVIAPQNQTDLMEDDVVPRI